MRELHTPFNAQPPAVTRFSTGTRSCNHARRFSTACSKCAWHEAARSLSRCVSGGGRGERGEGREEIGDSAFRVPSCPISVFCFLLSALCPLLSALPPRGGPRRSAKPSL